jgi:diguanylate cyclase (GGDEF)-like protein
LKIEEDLVWILSNTSHAISSNLLFTLVKRLRHGNDLLCESRARLEQYRFHATVDALTGLFNRHWLNQMLPRQMHRAKASAEPLSLLMADIDHFKAYNDSHGHPAGDHALLTVAQSLRDHVRPADMTARYGGEEFLVVLPACNLEGAEVVAERLRAAVASSTIRFANGTELPGVTASFGIATLTGELAMEGFIGACDKALYRAKRRGRNRVST